MKTYIIVTLLKGKAKEIQESLLLQISKQFDVHEAIKQKPPAHITLKYPFTTKNIENVEYIISRISKETKPFSFKVKGFNHFDKEVIFIDVPKQNGKLRELQQEIYKKFKEKKSMKWAHMIQTCIFTQLFVEKILKQNSQTFGISYQR